VKAGQERVRHDELRFFCYATPVMSRMPQNCSIARACCLAAFALSALSVLPAHAGAVLDHIRATSELRVGTTGDYKPFSYLNADGSYEGADVEMMRRLAAKLGVNIAFVPTRWADLSKDFAAGRFDVAVGGISILPARTALGPFAHTLVADGKRPIVRCPDQTRLNSLDALNQPTVRVIVNPGASNEAFAHAQLPAAALTVFADNAAIFDEIAAGRADVMVTDGIEVDQQVRLHPGVLCPATVAAPFTHSEKSYWLQPDPEFVTLVNGWLDEEIATGRWRKTLNAAMTQK
jgi:cyclohexadienyl dehydratase